ncbi:hypothetical protein ACGFIR_12725 [Micromonospora sp. NPDC049051]|uniref:hypothetical protein n=1 Tax=Micromonospora sp. NPDC049051 TaxID=3364264 RepID=UPI00371F4F5C
MGERTAGAVGGGTPTQPGSTTPHWPVPPDWECGGCASDWPCLTRRRELRMEFADSPVALALHLDAQLVRAMHDLGDLPAEHLHRRFLGWAR